jgi:spore germination protein GerM
MIRSSTRRCLRWRSAGGLVILAILLSACSIGAEQSPNVVAPQDVPSGLAGSGSTTTSVTVPSENVSIYLEGLQRLVTVNREVAKPAAASTVLEALAKGSTGAEAEQNLRSPISAAAPLSVLSIANDTVTVELATSFTNLSGEDQVAAAAQLVYTLTALPGIRAVSVRIGNRATRMPLPDGRLSTGALTRTEYASLAPV